MPRTQKFENVTNCDLIIIWETHIECNFFLTTDMDVHLRNTHHTSTETNTVIEILYDFTNLGVSVFEIVGRNKKNWNSIKLECYYLNCLECILFSRSRRIH